MDISLIYRLSSGSCKTIVIIKSERWWRKMSIEAFQFISDKCAFTNILRIFSSPRECILSCCELIISYRMNWIFVTIILLSNFVNYWVNELKKIQQKRKMKIHWFPLIFQTSRKNFNRIWHSWNFISDSAILTLKEINQ